MSTFLKRFWCDWFHGGGDIKRDGQGRINWQCRKCGRWSPNPVPLTKETAAIDAAIKAALKEKTMDDKPDALLLAKWLDDEALTWGVNRYRKVAAELRRLHEANAELLEALCKLVEHDEYLIETGVLRPFIEVERARVAISKAEGK